MTDIYLVAGMVSTALFVVSYLPMLHRAWSTRDLASYSRPSLILANVGNAVQAVYVFSLPAGPIWFLHGFYIAASAVMLTLHLRHIGTDQPTEPETAEPHDFLSTTTTEGAPDDTHDRVPTPA